MSESYKMYQQNAGRNSIIRITDPTDTGRYMVKHFNTKNVAGTPYRVDYVEEGYCKQSCLYDKKCNRAVSYGWGECHLYDHNSQGGEHVAALPKDAARESILCQKTDQGCSPKINSEFSLDSQKKVIGMEHHPMANTLIKCDEENQNRGSDTYTMYCKRYEPKPVYEIGIINHEPK